MKKIILLLGLTLMLFVSCVNDFTLDHNSISGDNYATIYNSENDAVEIALTLMGSRTNSRSNYNVSTIKIIGTENSRSLPTDTLIYAINFTDNKGFVLVSAAKTGEQILGYSDEGNFDIEPVSEENAFSFYLKMAKKYVTAQIDTGKLDPIPNPFKPVSTYDIIRPRVTQGWCQFYPEGMYCPNHISGCVQTAMALMLTALKQPTIMSYTYPGRDIDMETIDWNNIAKHNKSTYRGFADSHLESCDASESSHKTISRLCREFGYNNNAIYSKDRTTADVSKARQTMLNLLFGECAVTSVKAFENYTVDDIFSLLHKKDAVALIGGVDYSVGDFGASHAWVLCGGEQITTSQHNPTIGHEDEEIVSIKSYLFFNWGEFGSHNGYFPFGVFDQSGSVVPSRNNYDSEVRLFFVNNI